jgi:hypothetical protein
VRMHRGTTYAVAAHDHSPDGLPSWAPRVRGNHEDKLNRLQVCAANTTCHH